MTPATTIAPPLAQPPTPIAGTPGSLVSPTGPTPYRWTIKGYRELGKTGLFHDMKTMLIHGEVYAMVMPNPPHDTALNLAHEFLRGICPAGHHVRNQQGLDIGIDNDPGPDLAIVPGSIRDYATRTPTGNLAVLVVEVSDTTLFIDTTTKAELYATAGVPDHWVIDVENHRLLVFRDPVPLPAGLSATTYRTQLIFGPTDTIAPLTAPTATVRVADLLP